MAGWDSSPRGHEWLAATVAALIAALLVTGIGGCHNLLDDTCQADPARCDAQE